MPHLTFLGSWNIHFGKEEKVYVVRGILSQAPIARSVAQPTKFALRTNDQKVKICITDLAIGARRKRNGCVC